MGRFILDVFEVLSIHADPARAMTSLEELGGEEALILSLEEG